MSLVVKVLGSYNDCLPGILHSLVGFGFWIDADAMALAHENHTESAAFQHAGKLTFAIADGQGLLCVIPMERDRRIGAFFVVVAVVLVFVEREVGVRAPINSELDRVGGLLCGPFLIRPQRQNRSGADVERQALQWSFSRRGCARPRSLIRSRSRTTSTAADTDAGSWLPARSPD